MKIEPVSLSYIDTGDVTFLTGHKGSFSPVRDSIREIGLINFPVLRDTGESLQVVTGWKRIFALTELGFDEVMSKIYEPGELSDEACLKYIYHDNSGRLDDMELADLVIKFRDMLGLGDREMISDTLPFLGIPPSRKQYDRYLGLASLAKEIKEAYYRERITIEQCQTLSETALNERVLILTRVLDKYKLNNNEFRQVIKEIEEVALRDKRPVSELIDEIEGVIGDRGRDDFRAELGKLRYPLLKGVEETYSEALKSMNLPGNVNITTGPYFEGNDIEIRIRVKSAQELSDAISSLEGVCGDGAIGKLISIVREGE
ncbi:MAG: hypothetical protein RIG61_06930 [Deltaproteobacteria bacterium]